MQSGTSTNDMAGSTATKAAIIYATVAVVWAGMGAVSITQFLPGAAPLLTSAKASALSLLAPPAASTSRK
jgi:hypothetical protein